MRLVEQFKKDGDFLFAYRSYLPLILVPFIVLVIFSFDSPLYENGAYNNKLVIFALIVGLLGQLIRVFVAGFVPKDTSGRNTGGQKAALLNTSGIYSTCRNPLYLGNFLMMLSPVILVGNWIFTLCFCLAFWLYYERIIYAEEAFLSDKFKDSYLHWANSTPCFIPTFSHFKQASLTFSLKSTLRREYHSLFGLASSLLAVNCIELCIESLFMRGGGVYIIPNYILSAFFGLCLIVYCVCLILAKKTKILSVEGR